MAKTVTLDTLKLEGANIWVDLATEEIRLEVNYSISSSAEEIGVSKSRDCQDMLTSGEKTSVLTLVSRLKAALEALELV